MIIPYTVNKKVLELYKPPTGTVKEERKTNAEDFELWHKNIPKTLKELCIEFISCNWSIEPLFKEIPLLADRLLLLSILATDLPLEITVPVIHEDVYWKRCYEGRWPNQLPKNIKEDVSFPMYTSTTRSSSIETIDSNTNKSQSTFQTNDLSFTKTWKDYYLEMHIKEYLEYLRPEEYEPEKIRLFLSLCAPYVSELNLSQLQCSREGSDHIPFSAIIGGLFNLTKLSLTFQQTYVKEKFSWNIFKISIHDIQHLCKAFEKTFKLRTLRSNIDCKKFIMILRSPLFKNNYLKEIDFSSCNISDDGVQILCDTLVENKIEKITLANNKIGFGGAKALSQIIVQPGISLKYLNLRLNPIGSEGAKFLFDSLAVPSLSLQDLILAGCGIKYIKSQLQNMLLKNNRLRCIDLSNNRFTEELEKDILNGLELNTTLIRFDLRMCNLSSEVKHGVKNLLERNQKITNHLMSADV